MTKVSLGQGTKHIKSSLGPDTHHLSHYATSYASYHARPDFTPRPATHSGTGYLANFRPVVYYNESLDKLDNPEILGSIRNNYISSTKKHFNPSKDPSGTEPLPPSIYHAGSGFITGTVNTLPLQREVTDIHVNTRASFKAKHRPLLYNLQRKDPVELENGGEGPNYMKSETCSRFLGAASTRMNLEGKVIGHKECSGFVNDHKNIEPIAYRPSEDFSQPKPFARPTGTSNMKGSFTAHPILTGNEKAPALSNKVETPSGFVKGTYTRPVFYSKPKSEYYTKAQDIPQLVMNRLSKSDPAEYANVTNPHNRSSVTQIHFKPAMARPPFSEGEGQKLGRSYIGKKEQSGFCENNDRWIPPRPDPAEHYTTYYRYKHGDLNPTGVKREGYLRGSTMPQQLNGFTKSTALHRFGNDPESHKLLKNMNSYQARSLMSRDNLLFDNRHDAKVRVSV